MEWRQRHERAELVREHGRKSRGVEQDKEAWDASRLERGATERARRAWIIEGNPNFEALTV